MKLSDPIKRVFLSGHTRRMEMEAVSGAGGGPAPTSSEEEAEYLNARAEVVRAIRDQGVYWP